MLERALFMLGRPTWQTPRALIRASRLIALAVVIGMSIGYLYFAVTSWHMTDAGAYWNAAMRLREGQELYPVVPNVEASDVYRYAPWFAWLAVPFTYLPVALAGAIWSVILVVSSTVAVIPLVRRQAWLGVVFFWPMLIGISAIGNVHALMIAALVLGVERRSGPLWIAVAASLKAFPILFVMVYIGRREWRRAAACLILTALFVAPFLLYRLDHYPTSAGGAAVLITWPPVYAIVLGLCATSTLALSNTRWRWIAAAATVCLSLPRVFVYDSTYLLVGTVDVRRQSSRGIASSITGRGTRNRTER
jgi:hypothetical protein